jgi:protein involved in polysaccharide export with SLBB domain
MKILGAYFPQAKMSGARYLRPLLVAAFFLLLPVVSGAQVPTTKPTPEQARILLQTRPDLVQQLRERMLSSGLSPEQIRARLREEGYPENLLDAYMPGSRGDSIPPSATVLRAVQELGIADSTDLANGFMADTLFDSTGVAKRLPGAVDMSILSRIQAPYRPDTIRNRFARDSVIRIMTNPDSGFVIFGLDVFRSSTTQFQPNLAGPVDPNYRLGPGDRLVLILTGDVEASYSLDVTREGFVVVPQVGQLFVNNLTLGELERLLRSRLGRVYSGIGSGSTRFSINVARLRTNQVFVVGDVMRPGSYQVSSAGTALTALYAAGGPTINGSLRTIEIRRGGRTVDTLDVYDYLIRGDASHDVRLQSGDIVFVPVHGPRARVVGEIVRPATYEVREGEGLPQLLQAAGGFTATAARQRVFIERILPATERAGGFARTTIDVSSAALANGLGPDVPIRNGDVVRVFPIAEEVHNRITVTGNVNTPGPQGLTSGMTVADALRAAGGVKPDTYLGEVLVSRQQPDRTRIQLRARLADTTGAVINDFPLQENDQIQVFSLTTFRPQRYVAISGFVKKPGRYPYRRGMTMRDLVLMADGVKEGARLTDAEIARLPEDRSNGQTAVTIRVPLDSTYLFGRARDGSYEGPPGLQVSSAGAPEVPLEPYDNVLIFRQENFEYQRNVTLRGEVKFPGTYALKNKRERLRDLVMRAGGLTDEAQADGIVFVRNPDRLIHDGRALLPDSLVDGGVGGDSLVGDSLTLVRVMKGRIGLDLNEAMRNPKSADNLVLEDGDQIIVPRFNAVVRVQGAVNAPSNVAFVPGRDLNYYVDAAGGPSRTGDEGHAYVTQPSGRLESVHERRLLPDGVPVPRPGAVVTVPEKPTGADKNDWIGLATVFAQVVASLATIVVITRR